MSDIVYLETTGVCATLTTWVYVAMWQLHAAGQLGLRGYIHWPKGRSLLHYQDDDKFRQIPNMFDWYFEQPNLSPAPPREKVWTWEDTPQQAPEMAAAIGKHQLYTTPQYIKEFYKNNLRLNATVCTRGEALKNKYNLNFEKTIGVTWRGTDSIIDGRPRMPIETYFPFIDDILEKDPTLRIMCTAEEDILWPLLQRYPNAFKIEEFFTTKPGHQQLGDNPERFAPVSGFERGMQPAVMVWLFSQCKYLVKNRSSVSSVASWLSNGKIICLAHPENLGHGWDITKAEIEGRSVPL